MPRRTPRPCPTPGCPNLSSGGKCPECRSESYRKDAKKRGTFHERGYDAQYLHNKQRVRREEDFCWICRQLVDKTLSFPDPRSPSIDHVIPRDDGGTNDRDNLRLAHLGCNSSRGSRAAA